MHIFIEEKYLLDIIHVLHCYEPRSTNKMFSYPKNVIEADRTHN